MTWFPVNLMRLLRGEAAASSAAVSLQAEPDLVSRLSASHQEAARRLASPELVAGLDYREKLTRASREHVHPDLLRFFLRFSKELERRGYPMFPHEWVRDYERQTRLHRAGVSNASAGRSPHNFGMAVDIVHSTRFWEIDKLQWAVVGAIGKECARKCGVPIVWGGDWSDPWDPAHWELANWRERRAQLRFMDLDVEDMSPELWREVDRQLAAKKR